MEENILHYSPLAQLFDFQDGEISEVNEVAPKIEVNQLKIFSGKKNILELDQLAFPSSGVIAVMGPSGCGKSSLLKVMASLQSECVQYSGSIDVRCCEEEREIPHSRFAMIWQQPTVFPCSVWDNLKIPLRKKGLEKSLWKDHMVKALEDTGLLNELGDKWWKRRADCLSGGQQQRLCIAMGLLKDADILLFDEPTSALDPISTEKIEKIITAQGKQRLVVLVTHSIGQAKRLSQHTLMFSNDNNCGKLCDVGPTQRVFSKPGSDECRQFIQFETGAA